MTVTIAGLTFAHRLVNASGTLDALAAARVLGDATLGFAAHVLKTIHPEARAGNPPPRFAEVEGGMINSIGLPGPGVDGLCELLPELAAACSPVPLIASVGGASHSDYGRIVDRLEEQPVAAYELNLSCPNIESGCISIGSDLAETESVTALCRARTRRPLFVKLSPSVADVAELAAAAAAGGADAVVLTNTARGTVFDRRSGRPRLGGPGGGLSGPALRPIALAAVWATRQRLELPIVGVGGVACADDAHALLAAGATLVGIGTALFRDPFVAYRIRAELEEIVTECESLDRG